MTAVVLRGDAAHLPLPDESVDLLLCSPPYFGLRSYTDAGEVYDGQIGSEATPQEYVAALMECTREWVRVLRPSGSIFVNLGDKYAGGGGFAPDAPSNQGKPRRNLAGRQPTPGIRDKSLLGLPWRYALACMDDLGLILRRDIIWHKPNGLPESVTDRCRSSHEYLFHLVKQPRYYAAVDEIREPTPDIGRKAKSMKAGPLVGSHGSAGHDGAGMRMANVYNNPLGKLPGSVWEIPSQPLTVPASLGIDHFAAFPMELPRRIILGWSPPGICTECGEGRRPVASSVRTFDGEPRDDLPAWADPSAPRRVPNGSGHWRFATERRHLGYACACTPYTSHRGKRGDWREGREVMPGHLADDWHSPGVSVPRRPGGFGTKVPPPALPEREYHFDRWTPAPTRPAVVVDPFAGTGTTMLVASAYGRTGIGVDRSMDYARLARWRTTDPGERARALGVPKPPPVPQGQGSLFDEAS